MSGESQLPSESLVVNQAIYAWRDGKSSFNFNSTPNSESWCVSASLHGLCLLSTPTTNPAPQVFPMSKREVPLFPDTALLARERGARSSRERPTVTLLMNLRVGGRHLNADTPATMSISPSLCSGCVKAERAFQLFHIPKTLSIHFCRLTTNKLCCCSHWIKQLCVDR